MTLSRAARLRPLLISLFACATCAQREKCIVDPGTTWRVATGLSFQIPGGLTTTLVKTLDVTVTLPSEPVIPEASISSQGLSDGPHSVVAMFNGFKASADDYRGYARYLATAGYATVQYDYNPLALPDAATEVTWLPPLLEWLKTKSETKGSCLFGELDLSRLGVLGHSRGGKIATLHFTGLSKLNVSAAYLIDPVDNSTRVRDSKENPSSINALRASGKKAAITGAYYEGPCNSKISNYEVFYGAAAEDSWQMDVACTAHVTFCEGGLKQALYKTFCGPFFWQNRPTIPEARAREIATMPMLAWFNRHMPVSRNGVTLDTFETWVNCEVNRGAITFLQKGRSPIGLPRGNATWVPGYGDNPPCRSLSGGDQCILPQHAAPLSVA